MHPKFSPSTPGARLLAVATIVVMGAGARAATPGGAEAFPTFESYIKVSGRPASISGNEAAFQRRTQADANGGLGIEDLHYYRDLNKTTSVTIDGRALTGVEDYLGRVVLVKEDVGQVEVGYKTFRTFYDGIGGFFPINAAWYPLDKQDLHVDRGQFSAKVKLALPDKPVFTLSYINETRDGKKDSTIWGDSNLTGLPTTPSNNALRKILPAYLRLDERHELLEAAVEHTVGNTTAKLRLLGDRVDNLDTRYFTILKGEGATERSKYQADGIRSKSFAAIATTETELNAKATLNTGLSYQRVESDLSGERPNAIGLLPTYDFKDLVGRSKVHVYTANAALGLKVAPTLFIQPAIRAEDAYTKTSGKFTRVTGTVAAPVNAYYNENSRIKDTIVTPELSARYTGIRKVVIYATASDRITRGDERKVNPFATATPGATAYGYNDVDQDQARYTLGANWNYSSMLTFRGEVFHKNHENKFTGYANQLGSSYVIGYEFTGLKLTAVVKPVPELSLTTRYQPQTGRMNITTDSTAKFQSMDAESHLIGETIDWAPYKQVYFQGNLNLAYQTFSTAYPQAGGVGNDRQRNADNNYWSASFLSGFVVDKLTDAQLEYTYQTADNYSPELAKGTQPYGSAYEESTVTLAIKRKFSDRLMGTAKIGYIDATSIMTGGNTDFRGPLGYVSLDYSL